MLIVAVRVTALPDITTFLVIKLAEIVSTPSPPLAVIAVDTVFAPLETPLPNHFSESLPVPRLNLPVAEATTASVVNSTLSAPELAFNVMLPLSTVILTPGFTPLSERLTVAALPPPISRLAR